MFAGEQYGGKMFTSKVEGGEPQEKRGSLKSLSNSMEDWGTCALTTSHVVTRKYVAGGEGAFANGKSAHG